MITEKYADFIETIEEITSKIVPNAMDAARSDDIDRLNFLEYEATALKKVIDAVSSGDYERLKVLKQEAIILNKLARSVYCILAGRIEDEET